MQLDAARDRHRSIARPGETVERVDAGVSVGVDDTTRLRSRVRIESGSADEERASSRTPMLGVEKRF